MLTYSHQLKCTKPSWLLYKVKPSWRAIIFVWCTQVSWEGKKHVAMIRMLSGESWARNRNSKFAEQGEWEAGEKTCRVALVCVPQTPGRMFSKMTKRSKNHRSSSMSKSTKSSLTPYRHWLSCPYCEKKAISIWDRVKKRRKISINHSKNKTQEGVLSRLAQFPFTTRHQGYKWTWTGLQDKTCTELGPAKAALMKRSTHSWWVLFCIFFLAQLLPNLIDRFSSAWSFLRWVQGPKCPA